MSRHTHKKGGNSSRRATSANRYRRRSHSASPRRSARRRARSLSSHRSNARHDLTFLNHVPHFANDKYVAAKTSVLRARIDAMHHYLEHAGRHANALEQHEEAERLLTRYPPLLQPEFDSNRVTIAQLRHVAQTYAGPKRAAVQILLASAENYNDDA
jgi:hypothetical protein